MKSCHRLRDMLFRLRLYRGILVRCPEGLSSCTIHKEGEFTIIYRVEIDDTHPMADWLFFDCDGPWAVVMKRPLRLRDRYVAFSRPSDAVLFRMML